MTVNYIFEYSQTGVWSGVERVSDEIDWASLSEEEKNKQLFLKQKGTLDTFLEHGAISQAQYDKSLNDLKEMMFDK